MSDGAAPAPMLAAYLRDPATPHALRETMAAAAPPSLVLPEAIDAAVATELRARLEAAGLTAYALADRGRYEHNDTLEVLPLWAELGQLAADLAGRPMRLARARWIRQRRGDYSLVKDDSRTRPPGGGRYLEIVLDVSAGHSGEAQAVYIDGTSTFVVPQIGGVLAVVDRSPSTTRFLRPPTIRSVGALDVVRLIMQFQAVA